MGIRTKLSTNPAMTLGGLKEGVTPLEMAYAYSTIANHGERAWTAPSCPASSARSASRRSRARGIDERNKARADARCSRRRSAELAKEMLHLVVTSGTGKAAQVGDEYIWGKTGTTENYGDAWFVGGNDDMTVAVWVGYADKVQSMEYEHAGGPVAGGTFPAEIFHDFMTAWVQMRDARRAARGGRRATPPTARSCRRSRSTRTRFPTPSSRPTTRPRGPGRPGRRHARSARGHARARTLRARRPPRRRPRPADPAPTPTQPPTGGGGTGGGVTPDGTTG